MNGMRRNDVLNKELNAGTKYQEKDLIIYNYPTRKIENPDRL